MAMLQDDSTDEVTCCYLQLEERLRINRGDRSKRGMSSKDLKQLCNHQRKHFQDEQSSSSSSLDMYNDPAMPGPSSAYGLQNKKRQNGDKPNGQLLNSKRTCLDDKSPRSPSLLDYRYVKKNGDITHSRKNMDLTAEPISSSRNLLPGYTYEEHKDDSSECSDIISWPETAKTVKNNTQPKHSSLFEVPLPGPQAVQCLDSTSEDDSRTRQIGTLKGGRQSPEPLSNKIALRRKIRRVLDSDDSDSEDWPVGYRARPLVFSSSDSDDSKQGKKSKNKIPGAVSKKSDSPSYPTIDSQTLGQHLDAFRDRPPQRSFLDTLVDLAPNCSNGPARSPSFKSYKSRGSSQVNGQMARNIPKRDLGVVEGPSNLSRQWTLLGSRSRAPTTRADMQAKLSGEVQAGTAEQNVASSSRLPTEPLPFQQSGNKSRTSHPLGNTSREAPHTSNSSRRRALGRARSLREGPNLALAFPDTFDHEDDRDSSEVEFFTANSYSDNESNTESLGRRLGSRNFPEMRSNPSINVGSSEDEISVVYSSGPPNRSQRSRTGETRRRASRTLGRRYNRRSRRILPQRPGISLSPDPVEQVRQVEEDERFARVLQAQFDAEVDPLYNPRPHSSPNPCLMNIREASSSEDELDVEERGVEMAARELPLHYRTAALYNNLVGPHSFHAQRLVTPFFYPRTRVNAHWTNHLHHAMLDPLSFNDDSFEALLGLAELNGDVTRGLQKSQINRLPTRKFAVLGSASSSSAAELPHKRAELNKECQVCLNDYANGDVLRILPCFHEFHTPCIDPWLKINHTCPVCRVVVDLDE